MFCAEIDVNPTNGRGDVALKLNIQPVEIMYDEVGNRKGFREK